MRAHLWLSSSESGLLLLLTTKSRFLTIVLGAENAHFESAFNIYINIEPLSTHPDIHVPLYSSLLDTRWSAYVPKVILSLCSLLETLPDVDDRLSRVFWRIPLLYDHCLPLPSKERMCQVLENRIGDASLNPPPGCSTPDVLESQDFPAIISAMFFFPCDTSSTMLHWLRAQTKSAFDPRIALEIRWSNLLLVSTICCPGQAELVPVPTTTTTPPSSALWRLLINMGTLQQYLSSKRWSSDPAMMEGAGELLEDLWSQWTWLQTDCILPARQAMLASFLRVASAVNTSSLTALAIAECRQTGLWNLKLGGHHPQSIDLVAAFFEASYKSAGSWEGCLAAVADTFDSDGSWLQDVVESFSMRNSSASTVIVCDLHSWSRQLGVHPSLAVFQHFVSNLARERQIDQLLFMLEDVTLSPLRRECVLYSVLHSLRLHRVQTLNEPDSQAIVRDCRTLFAGRQIPHHLNSSFRYLLTVLARGTNPILAVQLLETLQHSILRICSPNFARRFVRQLFLRGNLKLVLATEGLLAGVLRPMRDSGKKFAWKHWDSRPCDVAGPLLGIRRLFKAEGKSTKEWNMAIRDAIATLVREGRFYTARKLYTRTALHLDAATRTAIGNIVLHGSLQCLRLRGRHRFRHIVNTKAYLEKHCQFSADRTTVNILVKAMLRWTSVFDSARVRHLFDQMVHNGYPAPSGCRRENSTPFGHANVDLEGSIFPKLPAGFSFVRHVRPMYKMFIKAFYLRRDVVAAKTVVGILKEVENLHWMEKEKRDRARREGIMRKKGRVRQACS